MYQNWKKRRKIIPKPFLTDTCVDKETLLHKNLKNLENLEKSLDKNMSMKGKWRIKQHEDETKQSMVH